MSLIAVVGLYALYVLLIAATVAVGPAILTPRETTSMPPGTS